MQKEKLFTHKLVILFKWKICTGKMKTKLIERAEKNVKRKLIHIETHKFMA